MANPFGIDLGTTNSCLAQIDEFGICAVRKNQSGKETTPSVVWYKNAEETLIGQLALNNLARDPQHTVINVKREMDKIEPRTDLPYGHTPVEVSAEILRIIVEQANSGIDAKQRSNEVVITCPATFSSMAKQRTKEAGEKAGLKVLAVVSEPAAAAVAYAKSCQFADSQDFIIFDLGGGTLDMAVLVVNDNRFETIVTVGNHDLGGIDWDKEIGELLLKKYNAENSSCFSLAELEKSDRKTYFRLLRTAEKTKQNLSMSDWDETEFGIHGNSSWLRITRSEFEEATNGLVEKIKVVIEQMVSDAKTKAHIFTRDCRLVFVGGSSRMPMVQNAVKQTLAKLGVTIQEDNCALSEPDLSIAKGAAYIAEFYKKGGTLSDYNRSAFTFSDVAAHSYGVEYIERKYESGYRQEITQVYNIILMNDALPAEGKHDFATYDEGQTSINVKIYESSLMQKTVELEEASRIDCDHHINFPGPVPKGTKICISFKVDTQGILSAGVVVDDKAQTVRKFNVKLHG